MLIDNLNVNFVCVLPEIFLVFIICYLLVIGSILVSVKNYKVHKINSSFHSFFWLTFYVLFILFFLYCNNLSSSIYLFYNMFSSDFSINFSKIILNLFSLVILFVSYNYMKQEQFYKFEFYILYLLSILGMVIIIMSNDLLGIYLGLELQSLALYCLAAIKRTSAFSTEAGLKYFIIGAFSSGLFLFGSSFIYGYTGTTNLLYLFQLFSDSYNFDSNTSGFISFGLVFLLASLLFKLSVAPWHFWSIDVYEGSPLIITLFFSIVPKISFFLVISKFCYSTFFVFKDSWSFFILTCSILSLFLGSFGALSQRKVKRFFVFSTVSHIGYLISSFSCGTILGLHSFFMYIFIYFIITGLVWLFLLGYERLDNNGTSLKFIDEFSNLYKENIFAAFTFCILLFSIAGIPPLAGFYAKLNVFLSLVEVSFYNTLILIIFASTLGCFYYLRLIKIISYQSNYKRNYFNSKVSVYSNFSETQSLFISFFSLFLLLFSLAPNSFYLVAYRLTLFLIFV